MKAIKKIQSVFIGLLCIVTAGGCSNDDEPVPGGGWAPMEWSVEKTEGNITVDHHDIIVDSPGGSVEMVCENYNWVNLYPYEGTNIEEGMNEEEIRYAHTHLSDRYVRISTNGNRMYCEVFDVPADYTGEIYRFTVTVGDRFEFFCIHTGK